ncbi:MAG: NAD(+)/NADH kinase [Bacillota bacterium]
MINLLEEKGFIITEDQPELIMVIGGDGTMLSAIRLYKFYNKPFVGINTGTLGFLPTVSPESMGTFLNRVKNNRYYIQKYPLLKAKAKTVEGDIIEDYGFNEVVIKHLEPKLMEAKIYVDDKPFNFFTGDGFIISTPMGATGYGIWAGGVAIHSDLQAYQLIPIHANDNSMNRPIKIPIIVPLETKMKFEIIKADKREVIVACDGVKMSNHYIAELDVAAAEISISILRTEEFDYFEYFKKKIVDKGEFRTIHGFKSI